MIAGDILYINYVFICMHIIDIYIHNYMHVNNYHCIYLSNWAKVCEEFPMFDAKPGAY